MDNTIRDISPWRRVLTIAGFFLVIFIITELIQIASPNRNTYSIQFIFGVLLICFLTGIVYTFMIYRRGHLVINADDQEINEWLDFHITSMGYKTARTNLRGIDVFEAETSRQLPASGPVLRYHQDGKIHLFGLLRQLEKLQNRLNRSSGLGASVRSHFD